MDEKILREKMEAAYEGWKAVQNLEYMSIRDVYECAFRHGVEEAEKAAHE